MDRHVILILFVFISCVFCSPRLRTTLRGDPVFSLCGYDACPKTEPDSLNVHLVPHSHDDVGWLKTVDQYYYGSKQNIQNAGVQYILDSVINELAHDPKKRFIYVETAFLWKWWMDQHDTTRHLVQKLVSNGQLEITGGGWVMNDEAVTHYQSTIDQFTWGFRKINDTFGSCGLPRIGWQIDPFGHSREQASILAQMGFDGLFIGRLDYEDKKLRLITKTPEMIWQGSPDNLGSSSDLFTHVLFNNYAPPPGFCFDLLCGDTPIIDNKKSTEYNVPQKVKAFLKYVNQQAKSYGSNNILLTMGMDFHYQAAHVWYKNMDKLIRYVNEQKTNGSKVNVFYSSPSCYVKAVHDANNTFAAKQDDFFPYADSSHSFWTGYFTSKPTLKYFERLGNNFLQACKQLYTLADLGPEDWVDLNRMREAMAVLQHHDAITGTAKDHVAFDYAYQLSRGFEECSIITNSAISKLMVDHPAEVSTVSPLNASAPPNPPPLESCLLLNISQCTISETARDFVVTVYNPLSHPVNYYVRLPVASRTNYTVREPSGAEIKVQMIPIPEAVINIPGRTSSSVMEVVFAATDLPPLGFRSYYVTATKNYVDDFEETILRESEDKTWIGNENLRIFLDLSGKPFMLQTSDGAISTFSQTFGYYHGYVGNNSNGNRASGAYIFRPNGSEPIPIHIKDIKLYKGPCVHEMQIVYDVDWVSQSMRTYKGEDHIEYEWQVGPIPLPERGLSGKEVITRYSTDLKTEGIFFTDANGRELIKRVRNFRPTWKVALKENVSGNYYPVTTKILIQDVTKNLEFAVMTDRAQGGSSLNDGELELMLHRRLLVDDNLGVSETLNETRYGAGMVVRGRHYVLAGAMDGANPSQAAQQRSLAQKKLLQPWIFLSRSNVPSFEQWKSQYRMEFSGVTNALPDNIHLLTLEPWKGRSILIRLEHFLEKNDDPQLSKPSTVNLEDLFSGFTVVFAQETTLGANQWLRDSDRLQWKIESNNVPEDLPFPKRSLLRVVDPKSVTLDPMQIRTFIVDVSYQGAAM